ncbi:MAG: sigma-70 family RNA polymerase sigma factor [Acidobacteria bacterium]|nr:MAG: sigma-70 family RNA polymerase sigma factor [Acidobacteriota bacterium]
MLSGMTEPINPQRETVEKAQRGDLEAYGRLVVEHEGWLTMVVRGIVRDEQSAEDVVQEAFLLAFRKLSTLHDPQAFPAWLRRIAVSIALNLVRGRRLTFVDMTFAEQLPVDEPAESGEQALLLSFLKRAMVGLSPADRRVCERFYHGGWTAARLAESEGISAATMRKRLERIRKQLRKEIEMNQQKAGSGGSAEVPIPERIIRLLSKPILTDLPENPVGAVWEIVKKTHPGHQEVQLAETFGVDDLESVVGDKSRLVPPFVHRVDGRRFLRWDLTFPMLLKSRELPEQNFLMAAGKVYRNEEENGRSLGTFHQAEVLLVGERDEWGMMGPVTGWLGELLPEARIRVEQMDFEMYADRGWAVSVLWEGVWEPVIGFARFRDDIVRAIGRDPKQVTAVGVGMGLERIACLKYGIDDVRKVEASQVKR